MLTLDLFTLSLDVFFSSVIFEYFCSKKLNYYAFTFLINADYESNATATFLLFYYIKLFPIQQILLILRLNKNKITMDDKLYYSIAEVSKEFDLPYSTLRFWETEFTKLKPKKNKRGVRFYTKEDVELVRRIAYLTKEKHFTLDGAKKAMKEEKYQNNEYKEVLDTLTKTKQFLLELKKQIKQTDNE